MASIFSDCLVQKLNIMKKEELIKLCDNWIVSEYVPETEDDEEIPAGLKLAGLMLEHSGRYSLTIKSKDFFPDEFNKVYKNEDDKYVSSLYTILTSPDENYYFGELELKSRHAYDVALLNQALRNQDAIDDISNVFAVIFDAIGKRDYIALDKALIASGVTIQADGSMTIDDIPDIVGEFTVFPIN
jgi:hypothetical protein